MTEPRTVKVRGGAYATIRAHAKATDEYGPNVTVTGIMEIVPSLGTDWYIYRVEDRTT